MTNTTGTTLMNTTTSNVTIIMQSLLPTHSLLIAYAIPMLLMSLPIIFAGTFLTMDRTRYFVRLDDVPNPDDWDDSLPGSFENRPSKKRAHSEPKSDEKDDILNQLQLPGPMGAWEARLRKAPVSSSPTKKSKLSGAAKFWRFFKTFHFCGGVGGAVSSTLFGIHLIAFLSTLPSIPAKNHLLPSAFIAFTIIVSSFTSLLGSRFRPCAIIFIPLAGSYGFATLLALTLHPSLAARLVLFFIILILLMIPSVLSCLPSLPGLPSPTSGFSTASSKLLARVLFHTLRFSTASLGAFSLLVSIALLSPSFPYSTPAWSAAHSVLFAPASSSTQPLNPMTDATGKDVGLTIFGWILLPLGIVADWCLHRFVGPKDSQAWDSYLATYSDNLPDRAGYFETRPNVFQRIENAVRGSDRKGAAPGKLNRKVDNKPAFFKRYAPAPAPASRHLSFDQEHRAVLSQDPKRVFFKPPAPPYKIRPVSSNSAVTLVDNPTSPIKGYDFESDITSARKALEDGEWKPGFMTLRNAEKKADQEKLKKSEDSDSDSDEDES